MLFLYEDELTYKVYVGEGDEYIHYKRQILNIRGKKCSCGKWWDTKLFCKYVMSYYRIIMQKSLEDIFRILFFQYYSYQYLNHIYKDNITPVIIETLSSNQTAKPPPLTNK